MDTATTTSTPTNFGADLHVLQHMFEGGEILSAQLPQACHWSPEKRLAAAVLTSALATVRDMHRKRSRRSQREAQEDLRWIESNDMAWPMSFGRICQLLHIDPSWVRGQVRRWQRGQDTSIYRMPSHRHAA